MVRTLLKETHCMRENSPQLKPLTVIPTTTWRKGCGVTWGSGVSLTAERSPFGLHMGIQNGSV